MADALSNLEDACPHCDRVVGDHTMREWSACMGTQTLDLAYQDTDEIARAFTQRMGLPDGSVVADHVIAKALVAQADVGHPLRATFPLVLLEFSRSPDVTNVIASVAFMGDRDTVRAFGRLIRDTSNGAANAAERAA